MDRILGGGFLAYIYAGAQHTLYSPIFVYSFEPPGSRWAAYSGGRRAATFPPAAAKPLPVKSSQANACKNQNVQRCTQQCHGVMLPWC